MAGYSGTPHERPRVIVTGSTERGVTAYLAALGLCAPELGPSLLLPQTPLEEVAEALNLAGGVVVTGGVDIHPAEYGDTPNGTETEGVQPDRDRLERVILEGADAAGLPVFAICRGMQMLNVHRGGALLQHIGDTHRDGRPQNDKWMSWHEVDVCEGSRLAALYPARRLSTNSRHHQAVDESRLGRGLRVTARTTGDGVVEAIEADGDRFVLGVQWHPENMALAAEGTPERASAHALFRAFADAVAKYSLIPDA